MKRVLIAVVSARQHPYGAMINTSMDTWDAEECEGTETVYYCARWANQHNAVEINRDQHRVLYFDTPEAYATMGTKNILFFQWALSNREWEYMARVNASCYVHKRRLLEHVQSLPESNVMRGLIVDDKQRGPWIWGGGQFLMSRDVVQSLVDNANKWNHAEIEDVAMSLLAREIGIPLVDGMALTIDKTPEGWRAMTYGSPITAFNFTDFPEINQQQDQFFYRVKNDSDRTVDAHVMRQLKEHLTP